MRFPEAIAEMRAGGSVILHRLFFLDFASEPFRVWDGFGPMTTPITGETWQGLGKVIRIEGGGQASGLFSSGMKLTVAFDRDTPVDPVYRAVLDTQNEIYGRRFFSAIQVFGSNGLPLDTYHPDFVGAMDKVSYRATATSKEITLSVEPPLVRKNTPRVTYFSDRNHKIRAPIDDFMARISRLQTKTISWPNY